MSPKELDALTTYAFEKAAEIGAKRIFWFAVPRQPPNIGTVIRFGFTREAFGSIEPFHIRRVLEAEPG